MKIALLSDIHLEIADWHLESIDDADVVILAGDIAKGSDGITWAEKTVADRFPDKVLIYVAGNHEYYESNLGSLSQFQDAASRHARLWFLVAKSVSTGYIFGLLIRIGRCLRAGA